MRTPALVFGSLLLASCVVSNDQTYVTRAPGALDKDPAQAVAARQAGMRMMVFTLASVSRAAEDQSKPLAGSGFAIGGLDKFGKAMPLLFDDATSSLGGNGALPNVWSDKPGFAAQIAQFQQATGALSAAAAANDRTAFASALASTKAACKACHDTYRVAEE